VGDFSPTAAFSHSSPRSTKAWILAFVIIDRTHTVRGSGMGAASAAISPLGLDLDLMEHKVLMCMCSGARRRTAALAHGWPELETEWMCARGKRSQGCGSYGGNDDNDGRKKTVNGVNPEPSRSIYRGSTGSARCGSFRRTMHTTTALSR
jgi:hypothetical protein